VIVEKGEIALVQVADELAVAVSRNKENVDFIDPRLDGKDGVAARINVAARAGDWK